MSFYITSNFIFYGFAPLILLYLVSGRKPCARVVFSPHGILKPPVLRQVKTPDPIAVKLRQLLDDFD